MSDHVHDWEKFSRGVRWYFYCRQCGAVRRRQRDTPYRLLCFAEAHEVAWDTSGRILGPAVEFDFGQLRGDAFREAVRRYVWTRALIEIPALRKYDREEIPDRVFWGASRLGCRSGTCFDVKRLWALIDPAEIRAQSDPKAEAVRTVLAAVTALRRVERQGTPQTYMVPASAVDQIEKSIEQFLRKERGE